MCEKGFFSTDVAPALFLQLLSFMTKTDFVLLSLSCKTGQRERKWNGTINDTASRNNNDACRGFSTPSMFMAILLGGHDTKRNVAFCAYKGFHGRTQTDFTDYKAFS